MCAARRLVLQHQHEATDGDLGILRGPEEVNGVANSQEVKLHDGVDTEGKRGGT